MIRRPPGHTRTITPLPYNTNFQSDVPGVVHQLGNSLFSVANGAQNALGGDGRAEHRNVSGPPAHAKANATAGTQAPPAHANANANANAHLNPEIGRAHA